MVTASQKQINEGKMKILITTALTVVLLGGCATRGANYVPLVDMKGRSPDMINQDIMECQQYAKQRLDAAGGAVAGAIIGALIGTALSPRGYRNEMAGYGATAGAISGGAQANETQEVIIKRCLAGRGYNVLN
jgi:uncharacterized protein YcfJ